MPVFSDFEQLLQQKLGNMVLTDKILLIFSGLGAKLDFLDLSLDDFKDIFQSQNISELRKKMIEILKEVFRLVNLLIEESSQNTLFCFTSDSKIVLT